MDDVLLLSQIWCDKCIEKAASKKPDDHAAACKDAMLALNTQLRTNSANIDSSYSGTAAIICWFHDRTLHVCNVRQRTLPLAGPRT